MYHKSRDLELQPLARLLIFQVVDAILKRNGVGCMLEWIECELILKEKTSNIQAWDVAPIAQV